MDGFGDIESLFSELEAGQPADPMAAAPTCQPDVIALVRSVFGQLRTPPDSVRLVCDVLLLYGYDTLEFCASLQQADCRDKMTAAILTALSPGCPDQSVNPRRTYVHKLFADAGAWQAKAEEKKRQAALDAEKIAAVHRKSAAVLRRQCFHLVHNGTELRKKQFAEDVQRWLFFGEAEDYSPAGLDFVNADGCIRCPAPGCLEKHYYEWRRFGADKSSPDGKRETPAHQRLLNHIATKHYGDPQLAVAEPGSTRPPTKRKPIAGQPPITSMVPKRPKPADAAEAATDAGTAPVAASPPSCF